MNNLKLVGTSTFTYTNETQLQSFLQNELKKAKSKNRLMVVAEMYEVKLNKQRMKQVRIDFYFQKPIQKPVATS